MRQKYTGFPTLTLKITGAYLKYRWLYARAVAIT